MSDSQASIVVCGPEHSGTRALHRIVLEMCPDELVVHRSVPHGDDWMTASDFPYAEFIVITRRPEARASSLRRETEMSDEKIEYEYRRAIGVLASLPDAYWLSYEALAANQDVQLDNLAVHLGVLVPKGVEKWLDKNAQYEL